MYCWLLVVGDRLWRFSSWQFCSVLRSGFEEDYFEAKYACTDDVSVTNIDRLVPLLGIAPGCQQVSFRRSLRDYMHSEQI